MYIYINILFYFIWNLPNLKNYRRITDLPVGKGEKFGIPGILSVLTGG